MLKQLCDIFCRSCIHVMHIILSEHGSSVYVVCKISYTGYLNDFNFALWEFVPRDLSVAITDVKMLLI